MAADAIWKFFPVTVGRPDNEFDSVWVERVRPIAVAPRIRREAYAQSGAGGAVLSVPVTEALLTQTIRIRYREDIDVDSFFQDIGGRFHNVNGWEAVGRRQFLDVSVTRYGQASPTVDPVLPPIASFVPPTGWTLNDDGAPVRDLTVGGIGINDSARRAGFQVTAPATWDATGFVSAPLGADYDDDTGKYIVERASDGADLVMEVTDGTRFDRGRSLWPAGGIDLTFVSGSTVDHNDALNSLSLGDLLVVQSA